MVKFPVEELERFYQIQKYAELVDKFYDEFKVADVPVDLAKLSVLEVTAVPILGKVEFVEKVEVEEVPGVDPRTDVPPVEDI